MGAFRPETALVLPASCWFSHTRALSGVNGTWAVGVSVVVKAAVASTFGRGMFPVDGSKFAEIPLVVDLGSLAVGLTELVDEPPPQATSRRRGAARSAPRYRAGMGHLMKTDRMGAMKIAWKIKESTEKERPPELPGA